MSTIDPIITGISDATAPYAMHLALSDMPAAIADTMLALARRCAAGHVAAGWDAEPSAYDLGAFHGDEEALDEALDRRSTRAERVSFEAAVRAALETARPRLCDAPGCRAYATSERTIEEVVHHLCAACAAECDAPEA